ncbi:hypothetical protein [Burkholderia pyrrocinia]|uniref:hypothetical protein n=1 Tax=Burkholderia pyrrocinia TaxID=60550 RepID=UPI001052D369|nr:hypothetical protein [Burkholderia pyrrocinia]TDA48281.1 hypothetical protein EVG18_06290 [Burkholderia pyrrocinia]
MIAAIDPVVPAQMTPVQPYAQQLLPPPDVGAGAPSLSAIPVSMPSAGQLARTLNTVERSMEQKLAAPLSAIRNGDARAQTLAELQMRMIRYEVWHEVVASCTKRLNGAIETLTR